MASKPTRFSIQLALMVVFLTTQVVLSADTPMPSDKTQLGQWFSNNVKPLNNRKGTLDSQLVAAEQGKTIIKVRQDGKGQFKTITDALKSIPNGNKKRVILHIGPGTYKEKIVVPNNKPFITFYGTPGQMPTLTYGGTAKQYGTVESGTLSVLSDYFVGANIIIRNSAPRPGLNTVKGQAVALRISGDKATFYNCQIYSYQDTLLDDANRHFFKDCYIQGTVDYIFGSGKSLYVNCEIRTLGDSGLTFITAQARKSKKEDNGFSFVHCELTGTGTGAYLGRAWFGYSTVIFSYCNMGNIFNKAGWSNNNHKEYDKTLYFGEYMNTGPGADATGRSHLTRKLKYAEVKHYLGLGMIEGSKWLLPPPKGVFLLFLVSGSRSGFGVVVAGSVSFFVVFSVLGYVEEKFQNGFMACPRAFDYKELKSATREFHPSRIVGHRSFGTVYKAFFISSGTIAVVKRSRHSHEGKTEFLSELSIIAGFGTRIWFSCMVGVLRRESYCCCTSLWPMEV
ncbi:pectinesterase [Vigna unguiculata]|uniref:Pectinesterase n=2 Tax=Vigna unguiculata TaxID=3917 RepID=A0A4D6LPB0_VIGUN|nr:pectinesterase [Vigna unguiculata]